MKRNVKQRSLAVMLILVLILSMMPVMQVSAAGSATGAQIVNKAMEYLGKVPYVWGGTKIDGSNPGADCSGFICRIYEKFGFNLWANRTKLRNCGTNLGTDLNVAQLGDIIWYDGHVAIYAGKNSSGAHMIVHETGGKYQNVVHTKASIVSAELKGVIRIPGVTNSGNTSTVKNASFTPAVDSSYKAKESVTKTNAVLVTQVNKLSGVKVTEMGMYLYDASGNLKKKHSEKVSNVSASSTKYHSWYDVNKEIGVTLTPGTTYKYKFYGIFNGEEIQGSTYSFTTLAGTYTATFCLNEDGSAVSTMPVTQGKAYGTLPTAYSKNGYTFDGWYTAKSGGTKITSSTVFNGTSNITLYPRYTAVQQPEVQQPEVQPPAVQSFKISYYTPEGRLYQSQTVKAGETYSYASNYPEKEGYTFKGWYTMVTGGTKITASTVVTSSSPHLLYAQYEEIPKEEKKYTVYYYVKGNLTAYNTITSGETYGILPTVASLNFKGWFTAEEGGTEIHSYTIANLTSDQKLYAQFDEPVEVEKNIILQIGNPKIYINGKGANIDDSGTVPVIRNSRTLLPVRAVIEAMDGTVGWDGASRIVSMTIDNRTLYLKIGSGFAWDSLGDNYSLDVAPAIINNRTMLPIRFIVEYFNGTVDWNGTDRIVTIHHGGK